MCARQIGEKNEERRQIRRIRLKKKTKTKPHLYIICLVFISKNVSIYFFKKLTYSTCDLTDCVIHQNTDIEKFLLF